MSDILTEADIPRERFGPLIKYLDNPDITDIDYNGTDVWVRDIYNVRTRVDEPEITPQWIDIFTQRIADVVSKTFNKKENVLEAETSDLRITCVHEASATSGKAVCIRKTSHSARINYTSAVGDKDNPGYANPEVLNLLINCMIGKMNFVVCGEPGVGKTEFAKFLCQYIPNHEKVITIEDNPEWHYKSLKPKGDGIELRTSDDFDYTKALKTCMRLNPNRVMLSEVRSIEAVHLIECWTAGVKGTTTLHTDNVKKIPDRILNMMPAADKERLENNIYDCLDIGILLKAKMSPITGKKYRYLDQVCFFERKEVTSQEKYENPDGTSGVKTKTERKNFCIPIVWDGEMISTEIPESKLKMLQTAGFTDPFSLKQAKRNSEKQGAFISQEAPKTEEKQQEKETVVETNTVNTPINTEASAIKSNDAPKAETTENKVGTEGPNK